MSDLPPQIEAFAHDGAIVTRAPGRANLIGEHTDYNEGFVLPIALDLATYVVGERDEDAVELATSVENEPSIRIELNDPIVPAAGWGRYVAAIVLALRDAGVASHGLRGKVISEVPVGAGLSSSAALEVALVLALIEEEVPRGRLAEICRRAENRYAGVAGGIMDQLTSAAAQAGHACLIDCRDNTIEQIPIPPGLAVLIIDSGISRALNDSPFNERVDECSAAAAALGVRSLRDATLA
ncbi:MAG: galactokinase, partial [Actinomycetota bacterium]|nr:galactokinase [Actinomycetota bacterium]